MNYKSLSQWKRNHFRLKVQLPVEFSVAKYLDQSVEHLREKRGTGVIHDLGEGGLSFFSPLFLPERMLVRLRFRVSTSGEFNELCRIIRVRPAGNRFFIAVKFVNMGGKRLDMIRHFIEGEVKQKMRLVEYI
ncbi:MAG TPA: PilZ domain-containing protein [Bacillota bacterium]|nr:PilZ domain-containing protein [Bacillota bacterium]